MRRHDNGMTWGHPNTRRAVGYNNLNYPSFAGDTGLQWR